MATIEMDIRKNGLQDFASAVTPNGSFGAQVSQQNTLMWNNRYAAITLNRALLSSLYMEHGIVQCLIDMPVEDALRGGINIKCDEFSADDIKEITSYLEKYDIINTYAQAMKHQRLYGGAGIIINVGQDTKMPLRIDMIKEETPLAFYAADRWELSYAVGGVNPLDQFHEDQLECPYNYYGHPLHKSCVIKLNGKIAPSLIRGQFGGWGMSELEKMVRSFNQYLKHQDVSFEILDEAKIDVFSISGFNAAVSTKDGAQKTAERIGLAATIKNYQNALVLDSEDTYEQKTMTFAGLAEIMTQIRVGLACDLRIPEAKLFGQSASGFASGEDAIENYNCMIESEIRDKNRQGLIKILKIVSQKLFGMIPESITFEYKPLRIMSDKDVAEIKDRALNRIITTVNTGLCTSEKGVELVNNEKIFGIDLDESEAIDMQEMQSRENPKDDDKSDDSSTNSDKKGNSKLRAI